MSEIKFGILHCHTDNSIRDSVMSVQTLVERAKELGAPAVALTDHGSMTGYIPFLKQCKKEDVKPILGVEAYVEEQDEGRKHLILMAKDYTGFQALIKAVSESNTRLVKVGTLAFPRMNKEMLRKYFGPGSSGHGHVIATSACVSGVLSHVILANGSITETVEAIKAQRDEHESPHSAGYQKNKDALKDLQTQQKELSVEIANLKKKAGRSLNAMERKYLTAPAGSEKQMAAKEAYDTAYKERADANALLEKKRSEKESVDFRVKTLNNVVKQMDKSIIQWKKYQSKIDVIERNYISDDEVDKTLKAEAEWYRDTFGPEDFYIELQYHGMQEEKRVMVRLSQLSDELGIPTCIANDAHIPKRTGDDALARAIIRATAFDKWEDPNAYDRELYIKTDEELIAKLSEILPSEKIQEGYENIGKIADKCNLVLPEENHYPKFQTPDGSTPEEYLRKMAYAGIPKRYPDGFDGEERLEHELDVICSMGYAGYHCIVEDLLHYARVAGKLDFDDPEQRALALSFDVEKIERYTEHMVGECAGPGRGSAAGSLVCYLIGITNIDPLKYGLLFERFLNPDRISMPDIDCDIESRVRPYTVEYVKHKYGERSVCGISTKGTLTGKAAILTGSHMYALQKTGDSTAYLHISDEVSKKAVELSDDELHISLKKIKEPLCQVFKDNPVALEIIRYAILIEGSISQIGMHAAGIIITDGKPVDDYVPLIYNVKNNIMTTQCDMVESEEIGLLKIDFLGLRNLTVITEALRDIYKNTGIAIDMDQIPYDDEAVFREIYAKAMTNSIFQVESPGMKNMLENFGPDNIQDLILLIATFRPGPMQYLPNIIAVKRGEKGISYLTEKLEPILRDTYGATVYQEQVQEIFRQLAGYSLGQADIVRRAMSKKKEKVLAAERESFLHGDSTRNITGCVANGISEQVANKLFDEMTDFAKYAFNKSHAACYAVVSYQTAWLKLHYPREYMKAVLNSSPFDKVPGLVMDLRSMGIEVKAPDVNYSRLGFSLLDNAILFGLGTIKGLGDSVNEVIKEREKNGYFQSLSDFVIRTNGQKKILEGMTYSGAFDAFCDNRAAVADLIPEYLKHVKKIKDYQKKLVDAFDTKKIANYQGKINEYKQKIQELSPDTTLCENGLERLKKEKECLGVFVSKHPMELFPSPEKNGAIPIINAYKAGRRQEIKVTGIISDFQVKYRRKDGAPMGFFTLSDLSGQIEVCCFTDPYAQYQSLLAEDEVVQIIGEIMEDQENPDRKKLSVKKFSGTGRKTASDCVQKLQQQKETVIIYVDGVETLEEGLWNFITPYISQNGNPVKIYDLCFSQYRDCDFLISPTIIQDPSIQASIMNIA